jgi:hypothetical protein
VDAGILNDYERVGIPTRHSQHFAALKPVDYASAEDGGGIIVGLDGSLHIRGDIHGHDHRACVRCHTEQATDGAVLDEHAGAVDGDDRGLVRETGPVDDGMPVVLVGAARGKAPAADTVAVDLDVQRSPTEAVDEQRLCD